MRAGGSYYVYALKDPRSSPAKPFYVGKGTGVRAWEHLLNVDATKKGARIQEILEAGQKPIVTKLVEDLTERESLRIEAELISAFGTEAKGGLLTNSVIPAFVNNAGRKSGPIVPVGTIEKAQWLKPLGNEAADGTAKAVPFQNSDLQTGAASAAHLPNLSTKA